ncbi:MAG TPA: thiol reductant ABC exporter subunit CydC [Coxiellaceae bacterium]|nr:MAG: thiol reductant ABC exporter subunit CydC [Gammaproteobacteria bacterium RIFCSPHIGHO2_12_FULL_36_30]HLB56727.1 thiol reductant ABC exporter subunit CydC [Coxiellaceae bacterium]
MNSLLFFTKKLSAYKSELIIGILLSIALSLSSIALLTLSGWFISASAFAGLTIISAAAFNYFIPASMIRLLAFIRILSRYFDRVINHDFTFRILSTLRIWFYEKLIPLTPAQLMQHRSSDLLNRIVHDIDTLDHLYLNVLSPIIVALFLLFTITFFTAYFTIHLASIIFIIFAITLTFIPWITYRKSKVIGKKIQDSTAQLRIQTIDFLQGFVDLLLYVKKEDRLTGIKKANDELMCAQRKLAILKGFTMSMTQLLSGLTIWLILFCGIPLVQNNIITGAELAMIVLLIIATFEQSLSLPFAFLSLGKTKAAADRLLSITEKKPSVTFSHEAHPTQYDIIFKDVYFTYPGSTNSILNNFNLTIPAKTHLGISGVSGVGKTTIANLLARIWDPTSGEITIGGINLKDFSEANLRQTISFVTQQVHIFNNSVRENIAFVRDNVTNAEIFSVLEKVDMENHIRALPDGLNTIMGEFGKNFSGGQIRRIAIARALLLNSPILILDEPSAGLEDALMQQIWKNCEADFENKTVIVMTHDEKLLKNMSDHFTICSIQE